MRDNERERERGQLASNVNISLVLSNIYESNGQELVLLSRVKPPLECRAASVFWIYQKKKKKKVCEVEPPSLTLGEGDIEAGGRYLFYWYEDELDYVKT